MAVSNQERTTPKKIYAPPEPAARGAARFVKPTSGLDRVGIESAIALKYKKIKNLKLPANF